MTTNHNLPPGVLTRDLDGPEHCEPCGGSGTVRCETCDRERTCPNCAGLGVPNQRVKEHDEE